MSNACAPSNIHDNGLRHSGSPTDGILADLSPGLRLHLAASCSAALAMVGMPRSESAIGDSCHRPPPDVILALSGPCGLVPGPRAAAVQRRHRGSERRLSASKFAPRLLPSSPSRRGWE
jgi:hypothetical protein